MFFPESLYSAKEMLFKPCYSVCQISVTMIQQLKMDVSKIVMKRSLLFVIFSVDSNLDFHY